MLAVIGFLSGILPRSLLMGLAEASAIVYGEPSVWYSISGGAAALDCASVSCSFTPTGYGGLPSISLLTRFL